MCRPPWCAQPRLQALPQGDRTPHYGCSAVTAQATDASLPKLTGQYGQVSSFTGTLPPCPARTLNRSHASRYEAIRCWMTSSLRASRCSAPSCSTGAAFGSPATCPVPG
jgi:hypothetical protein